MNELNKRLAEIQQNLKAPKKEFNKFGGYNYRSCEDILEAVKPLLNDTTLLIWDEIVSVGDRYYVKATAELYDGENSIKSVAYAREAEKKTGMDEAQITGAASSYARKYALNGLFAIDDTKDADTKDNSEKETKSPYTKRTVRTPVKKPQLVEGEDTIGLTAKKKVSSSGSYEDHVKVQSDFEEESKFMDALLDGIKESPESFSEDEKILRDSKGHTYCSKCGKVVGSAVEKYSLENYGKILCMNHQKESKKLK